MCSEVESDDGSGKMDDDHSVYGACADELSFAEGEGVRQNGRFEKKAQAESAGEMAGGDRGSPCGAAEEGGKVGGPGET